MHGSLLSSHTAQSQTELYPSKSIEAKEFGRV